MKEIFKAIVVWILTLEATLLLKKTKPKVVAITGSVGKTSTKDAVYAVLKDHLHTRKSEKSFNTEIGVPLTVLGLHNGNSSVWRWLKNIVDGFLLLFFHADYPEVLVLETGVDRPGDMKRLVKWLKPDVVVITRLPDVPVHVENFSSPQEVVKEKLLLLDSLKSDGVFVYNHDDEKVRQAAENTRQKTLGFSRYSVSDFSASGDEIIYDGGRPAGIEFELTHGEKVASIKVAGSIGVQHAYNYAAAAAAGSVFGVELEQAMASLTELNLPPGRMKILRGIKDTLIIDDSYNSSPTATERSLQSLKEIKGVTRKIAVLGDMMELGRYSVAEHERVGRSVVGSADVLVTVGVRARKIAEAALESGMSEKNIFQYDLLERARKDLLNIIEAGDVILVKGSQSVRLEKLVGDLLLDQDRKAELLVRQDQDWLNRP